MLVVQLGFWYGNRMKRYSEKELVSGHKFAPGQIIVWL